ncbi:hypothetical protein LLG95_02855 [bacterium]|nr:hypothetical protein [bacterium]
MKLAKGLALMVLSASLLTATGCVALVVGNRGLDVEKLNGGKSSSVKSAPACKCNPEMAHMLKSPDGKMWRVTVDNFGQLRAVPADKCQPAAKAPQPPADARAIGAPTHYNPDKDTEPIPTVDIGAKK